MTTILAFGYANTVTTLRIGAKESILALQQTQQLSTSRGHTVYRILQRRSSTSNRRINRGTFAPNVAK
jgi:hypothetical protein